MPRAARAGADGRRVIFCSNKETRFTVYWVSIIQDGGKFFPVYGERGCFDDA